MQTTGISGGRQDNRADLQILLADGKPFMRQIISNALSYGGFRNIRLFGGVAQLADSLGSAFPDLLILDSDLPDGDAAALVHDMRHQNLGRNPFIPIIMTIWNADRRLVRRVIDGGADALLVKPFAAGQLIGRIENLACGRKPFVATTDYVGPERRETSRGSDTTYFDPPNTLRDKFEGRSVNLSRLMDEITDMSIQIREARVCALAASISRLVKAAKVASAETVAPEKLGQMLDRLMKRCETLAEQTAGTRFQNLDDRVRCLAAGARAVQAGAGPLTREQIETMMSLSDAICAATGIGAASIPGASAEESECGAQARQRVSEAPVP